MNSSPNSERTRLARELHDGLAQELASLGYRLDQIIGSNNLDNINRTPLRQIRFSISGLINQVRDEIFELRTNESKSFKAQLDQQLSTILSHSEITYEIHGEIEVKSNQRFELMRAVRELVFNAVRHAECSVIQIKLTSNQIEIEDNGVGGVNEKQNSYGLLGVRERLAEIGAQIDIKSGSTGSTILISL
jgi:signal transduction histidine kinase